MSNELHLLLNTPWPISEAQIDSVKGAVGKHAVRITQVQSVVAPDELDGAGVDWLMSEHLPRQLSRWPQLKVAHLLAAGTDHLHEHPVWKSPVKVYTASGTNAQPIAEYISMMMVLLTSRIYRALDFRTNRNWKQRFDFMARETLVGKTVGVIGYGNIGRETARQLSALGMNVVVLKKHALQHQKTGFNPFPGTGDDGGDIPKAWFAPQQIGEMCRMCDALAICAPRTTENTDMIRLAELQLLKPGAVVIVASRGGIVNEQDLAQALQQGIIGAAAVDCYLKEPPPEDHPLFSAPNCVLTPHLAGVYSQAPALQYELLTQNIARYVSGQELLNHVQS